MDMAALFSLSCGICVVGSRRGAKLNGQISNAVMQVTDSPPQLAVAINKANLTHGLVEAGRDFTVTVLSEEAPMEFIGRFGFRSGRDIEKFEGIGVELAASECPYPTDYALAYMDLEVVNALDAGTHTVFVGETTDARLIGEGRPMTYAYYREVLGGKTPPTAPTYRASTTDHPLAVGGRPSGMKKYVCDVCGYVYEPEKGDPERGVEPGTAFEELPDDWVCPVCGAEQDEFSEKE